VVYGCAPRFYWSFVRLSNTENIGIVDINSTKLTSMYTQDTPAVPNAASSNEAWEQARVFELAAELFGILATPMRLRILSALCDGEKSVSQLLTEIDTTQPNLSQHLNLLYRSGVLAKRKEGTQVIYRVQSDKAVSLCRTVCSQIAIEMDEPSAVLASERLSPRLAS
jgi:DNA-binding transcriptional ArsR family regulator